MIAVPFIYLINKNKCFAFHEIFSDLGYHRFTLVDPIIQSYDLFLVGPLRNLSRCIRHGIFRRLGEGGQLVDHRSAVNVRGSGLFRSLGGSPTSSLIVDMLSLASSAV